MPENLAVQLNGATCRVAQGTTVAAALLLADQPSRISVTGEPRAALCGMGICFECRAIVNGIPHRRTCQIVCEQGMTVESDR
ncbi:MAG TPA: (2Fe-2S)-binding protein [Acidobacteriaceae bacterium]|nr:(2Fe-2S)-binding protein [Acidobacteriaceae bacterium]